MNLLRQQIEQINARYNAAATQFKIKLGELDSMKAKEIAAIQEQCSSQGHKWKCSGHEDHGKNCVICDAYSENIDW